MGDQIQSLAWWLICHFLWCALLPFVNLEWQQ